MKAGRPDQRVHPGGHLRPHDAEEELRLAIIIIIIMMLIIIIIIIIISSSSSSSTVIIITSITIIMICIVIYCTATCASSDVETRSSHSDVEFLNVCSGQDKPCFRNVILLF